MHIAQNLRHPVKRCQAHGSSDHTWNEKHPTRPRNYGGAKLSFSRIILQLTPSTGQSKTSRCHPDIPCVSNPEQTAFVATILTGHSTVGSSMLEQPAGRPVVTRNSEQVLILWVCCTRRAAQPSVHICLAINRKAKR
jgi:hypothetical protein